MEEIFRAHMEGYIQLIVFIATAVWAVSKIGSTVQTLATSMNHLKDAVVKLDHRVEAINRELMHIRDRVVRLETKIDPNE